MLHLYELEALGELRIEELRRERAVTALAPGRRAGTPAWGATRRRAALTLLALAVWLAPSLREPVAAERCALAAVRA